MFEIGFPELMLIAIVGLLVIGPERLPEALRTLGLWFGRMRRSFTTVKAEIEKEIGMDEVKRQLHNEAILDEMKRIEAEVKQTADTARSSINEGVQAAEQTAVAAGVDSPADQHAEAVRQANASHDDAAQADVAQPVEAAEAEEAEKEGTMTDADRDHSDVAEEAPRDDAPRDEAAQDEAARGEPVEPQTAPRRSTSPQVDAMDYAIGDISAPSGDKANNG